MRSSARMRAALISLGLLLLTSCGTHGIAGDGAPRTETRPVGAFTGLDAATAVEVVVTRGAPEPLGVTTDGNLLPLLETTVVDGKLRVRFKGDVRPTVAKIAVHVPHLGDVRGAAGARVDTADLEEEALAVEASSGAKVHVAGRAKSLTARASSGAVLDASGLVVPDVEVKASSGAKVHLRAPDTLKGEASSGARVTYQAAPKHESVSTSSGARVEQAR